MKFDKENMKEEMVSFWTDVFRRADKELLNQGMAWKCKKCGVINWLAGVWENECKCGEKRRKLWR